MAGRKDATEKFLVPAHFQVNRSKGSPPKKAETTAAKLLPPAEYKAPKGKEDLNLKALQTEIDHLQNENKRLRDQLQRSSEEEIRLQGEIRKNRILVQKGRVDDALDLKRMAEVQEENLALQSEVKKQSALISKLKTNAKQAKSDFEADFEKTEAELERANSFIKELKAELREKEEIFEKETQGLEKLSKKQMAAIKNLKAEVHKVEGQVKIDRKGFEDVLSKNEYEKYEQVKTLEQRLQACETRYSNEVQEMKDEITRTQQLYMETRNDLMAREEEIKCLKNDSELREKEHLVRINEYQEKLQGNHVNFEKCVSELRGTLEEKVVVHQKEVEQLSEKLSDKEEELTNQCSLVNQLRAYIGENLPNTQIEKLQKENEEVKKTLANLMKENENLRSTVELLNVRLSSINEILSIQEAELMKLPKKLSRDMLSDQSDDLLTKWREKVFALLVQLKSQEILREEEERLEKAEIKLLMTDLKESQKERAMLSHALADRKAELQIEVNRSHALQRELEKCQANEKSLESFVSKFQRSAYNLQDVAEKTESFVESVCSQIDDAFRKLAILSQRVSFASGRIQFFQGLMSHREAQLRNKVAGAMNNGTDEAHLVSDDTTAAEAESGLSHHQLSLEVERLTKERDHLLLQVRNDSEVLDRKEAVIRAQCDSELQEAALKTAELESSLKDERERVAAVSEKLATAEVELMERLETIETLKTELAKHKEVAERTLDKVVQAEQARFVEEFAKLEKQFNDVRREHAKAVVALRQAERQVTREKEKSAEQLSLQNKEYENKLKKCQLQLRSLEKERNMLMATVRQEGLKVPRSRPKELNSSSEEPVEENEKENRDQVVAEEKRPLKTSRRKQTKSRIPVNQQGVSSLSADREGRQAVQAEKEDNEEMSLTQMTSVLKDLQSLSTALLTMDKESEDSHHSL